GQIVPAQYDAVQAMYGEGGACWCNGDDQAQECYGTCVTELEKAIDAFPTAQMCHQSWCRSRISIPTSPSVRSPTARARSTTARISWLPRTCSGLPAGS